MRNLNSILCLLKLILKQQLSILFINMQDKRKNQIFVENQIYSKDDAEMTRGMAIMCMLILNLFCCIGKDVFGTSLIWINETTPLVLWFSQKTVRQINHYVWDLCGKI